MTVVESYAGGKKTDTEQLPATITSLCVEGIAQNTTGSIYVPEVSSSFDSLTEECNF